MDVSLHRDFLGFGPPTDPEAVTGQEQRRRLEALQTACTQNIRDRLRPALAAAIKECLGSEETWSIELDGEDPQTLLFHFPPGQQNSWVN